MSAYWDDSLGKTHVCALIYICHLFVVTSLSLPVGRPDQPSFHAAMVEPVHPQHDPLDLSQIFNIAREVWPSSNLVDPDIIDEKLGHSELF